MGAARIAGPVTASGVPGSAGTDEAGVDSLGGGLGYDGLNVPSECPGYAQAGQW